MNKPFNTKRPHLLIALVALILVIAACTCNTTTTGLGDGSANGTVSVVNNSSTEICYLYISPAGADTQSEDKLGAEETIPTGSTRDFTEIPAGSYDLRAEDCSGNLITENNDVTVNGGATTTWTLSDN